MTMIARLLLLAAALFATAEAAPPAVLTPYMHADRFDPGDYRWMRGRFADADAADKANWQAIQAWLTACRATRRQAVEAELRALGVARARLDGTPLMTLLCEQVAFASPAGDAARFATFEADLRMAKPIADTYLYAVGNTDAAAQPGSTLAEALMMRPVTEQMLRHAMNWGEGDAAAAPLLTPGQRAIVLAALQVATARVDHANTQWLKKEVAAHGWPSISTVGKRPSVEAWLLVQHADADPAFQLAVLRLMAPLDARHVLPPTNYAYLYDRVMLKLVGTQRYGTQMTCAGGRRVPLPLEDAAVATWRAKAGMKPIADYIATMNQLFGPCRPTPPAQPVGARSAAR